MNANANARKIRRNIKWHLETEALRLVEVCGLRAAYKAMKAAEAAKNAAAAAVFAEKSATAAAVFDMAYTNSQDAIDALLASYQALPEWARDWADRNSAAWRI